jgi:hypothetical protein
MPWPLVLDQAKALYPLETHASEGGLDARAPVSNHGAVFGGTENIILLWPTTGRP